MARAHGSGSLVKRGKYFTAKWMVKGKLYTRSTHCSTKRDAMMKLEEFTKPFRENNSLEVIENLAAKVRVAEAGLKQMNNKKVKPIKIKFLVDVYKADIDSGIIKWTTEKSYESVVNVFEKFVKKTYAYEVTRDDVEKFLTDLKNRASVSRYNMSLNALRTFFDKAMKKDYRIRSNPFANFKHMKGDKVRSRRELTDDEVKALCKAANDIDPEMALFFEIGIYTGLRRSDCLKLKWSSIDFKTKFIVVTPAKTARTGMQAKIPLHPKLMAKLETLQHNDSGYILPKLNEFGKTKINNLISEVFKNAGVDTHYKDEKGKLKITTGFHALRHYFISQCVRNGIPVSAVQRMVAHSSADMSLAYTHVFDSDLRLPDYDGEYEQVMLKKTTVAALNKAKGILDFDEFIMKMIEGKPTTLVHIKTKESMELDKALDEMFADGKQFCYNTRPKQI